MAWVFFLSGLQSLRDWQATLWLYENCFHVALLPPDAAAVAGTAGEVLLPPLLALGLFGRFGALGLFVVNAVALLSYLHALAIMSHFIWGILLLMVALWGPGAWSLDAWRCASAARGLALSRAPSLSVCVVSSKMSDHKSNLVGESVEAGQDQARKHPRPAGYDPKHDAVDPLRRHPMHRHQGALGIGCNRRKIQGVAATETGQRATRKTAENRSISNARQHFVVFSSTRSAINHRHHLLVVADARNFLA